MSKVYRKFGFFLWAGRIRCFTNATPSYYMAKSDMICMRIKIRTDLLRAIPEQKGLVIHENSTQYCNIVGYLPKKRS